MVDTILTLVIIGVLLTATATGILGNTDITILSLTTVIFIMTLKVLMKMMITCTSEVKVKTEKKAKGKL